MVTSLAQHRIAAALADATWELDKLRATTIRDVAPIDLGALQLGLRAWGSEHHLRVTTGVHGRAGSEQTVWARVDGPLRG